MRCLVVLYGNDDGARCGYQEAHCNNHFNWVDAIIRSMSEEGSGRAWKRLPLRVESWAMLH